MFLLLAVEDFVGGFLKDLGNEALRFLVRPCPSRFEARYFDFLPSDDFRELKLGHPLCHSRRPESDVGHLATSYLLQWQAHLATLWRWGKLRSGGKKRG